MFTQQQIDEHRERLEQVVATVHHFSAAIFILTFIGYGLAVYLWFQDQTWAGLIVATFSYLFFRQFRSLSLGLARMKLREREGFAQTWQLLDEALKSERPQAVMLSLETRLRAPREPE
ncbi:hypothetical protein [Thioalkalivibrio sulfidiphilus]|uniref:Uncharacterized protein n=1 Tax=Thioalkalivibrio sulfidiphilus (strain HL-EbGR7) TaxID=396588 RepID=B8GQ84_THISH|nr:hypothetical protein [Thioalkalivibrio sulfidiphilus]ACL72279.1 hypothetical protein Tgr7_1193 [Thioalkalivibrio sulfidiphilus HL-EbGr7]